LDAFARHQHARSGIPTIAVNWGLWEWDEWQSSALKAIPAVSDRIKQFRKSHGITFDEGIDAVIRILGAGLPRLMALPLSPSQTIAKWRSLLSLDSLKSVQTSDRRYPRPNLHTAYLAPRNADEQQIAELWAECLSLDKVGVHDNFMELGGNSLLAIGLVLRLQGVLQRKLAASILYEAPSVRALCAVLCSRPAEEELLARTQARVSLRRKLRESQMRPTV
jgi:hypothetical protein